MHGTKEEEEMSLAWGNLNAAFFFFFFLHVDTFGHVASKARGQQPEKKGL